MLRNRERGEGGGKPFIIHSKLCCAPALFKLIYAAAVAGVHVNEWHRNLASFAFRKMCVPADYFILVGRGLIKSK